MNRSFIVIGLVVAIALSVASIGTSISQFMRNMGERQLAQVTQATVPPPSRIWTANDNSSSPTGSNAVAFSKDGTLVADASWQKATILRTSDGSTVRTLSGNTMDVSSVSFSPNGSFLVTGGQDKTMRIYDVSTGNLRKTITLAGPVRDVAVSPDGTLIASVVRDGSDNAVRLWNAADGTLVRALAGSASGLYAVSFSPDGTTVAAGGVDRALHVWNVATGAPIAAAAGHTDFIMDVAYSPDGSLIATASLDLANGVKVWRTSDYALVRNIGLFSDGVSWVSFSPDGSTLMAADWDSYIKFFKVSDGSLLATLKEAVLAQNPTFSNDGTSFAYGVTPEVGSTILARNPVSPTQTSGSPVVTISSPTSGASYSSSAPVALSGAANDPTYGNISSNMGWSSSVDGNLGTGGSINATLSPGAHTITAQAVNAVGKTGSASVTISVVSAEPYITVSPTSVNFGRVGPSTYAVQTIAIANKGTVPLIISGINSTDAHFTVQTAGGITVAPNASVPLTITFTPGKGKTAASVTGSLQISHNATNTSSPLTVFMQGIRSK